MPVDVFEWMTQAPHWPGMLALAHTVPYENAIVGDGSIPRDRFAGIVAPTLVIDGGDSAPTVHESADDVAAAIADSRRVTIPGAEHAPAPEAVAPVLLDFFR